MSEICKQCGGYIGSVITRQLPAMDATGTPYPIVPVPPVKLCNGHHETSRQERAQLHAEAIARITEAEARIQPAEDVLNRLGGYKLTNIGGRYTVSYDVDIEKLEVCVWVWGEIVPATLEDQVSLSPQQALSLLAWLRQEEQTLERLAKGHEG